MYYFKIAVSILQKLKELSMCSMVFQYTLAPVSSSLFTNMKDIIMEMQQKTKKQGTTITKKPLY